MLGGNFFFFDGEFLLGEMDDSRFCLREFFTNFAVDNCFHSGCIDAPFVVDDLLGECAEGRLFFVGGGGGDCCGGQFVTNDDCEVIVDADGEEWYEGLEDERGIVEDLLLLGVRLFNVDTSAKSFIDSSLVCSSTADTFRNGINFLFLLSL